MEDLKQDIAYLNNEGKRYVESEIRLAKLEAVEAITAYSSEFLSLFVLSLVGLATYAVSIVALGLYFAQTLESLWQGILLSAGISAAILVTILILQKYVLRIPFQNRLIKMLSKYITI
jgi:uncharacterized membrane protein